MNTKTIVILILYASLVSGCTQKKEAVVVTDYVDSWRKALISADTKSWVLFENGTVVVLMAPEDNLKSQALDLLKEWGPVHVGSPTGDFSVIPLSNHSGWIVTCHHNDILTYVAPSEIKEDKPSDVMVGLHGRSKRGWDAHDLKVIHIEDNRKATQHQSSEDD
jgi:hypothetical protein